MSKRPHTNPNYLGYEIDSEHGFVSIQTRQPGQIVILENVREPNSNYMATSFILNGSSVVVFPLVKQGLYMIKTSNYGNSGNGIIDVHPDTWTQAAIS